MGYELDRLMQQYGVSTPTVGIAPTTPATLGAGATAEQKAAYTADKAAYDVAAPKFDAYQAEYKGRLGNTPMYMQQQFQTPGNTPSTAYTFTPAAQAAMTPGGIGMEGMNTAIRDWMTANPNATPQQIAEKKSLFGLSDFDVRNAMGTNLGRQPAHSASEIQAALVQNPSLSYKDIMSAEKQYNVSPQDIYNATGSRWGGQLSQTNYLPSAYAPATPATPVTYGSGPDASFPATLMSPAGGGAGPNTYSPGFVGPLPPGAPGAGSPTYTNQQILDAQRSLLSEGASLQNIYNAAQQYGVGLDQWAAANGVSTEEARRYLQEHGVDLGAGSSASTTAPTASVARSLPMQTSYTGQLAPDQVAAARSFINQQYAPYTFGYTTADLLGTEPIGPGVATGRSTWNFNGDFDPYATNEMGYLTGAQTSMGLSDENMAQILGMDPATYSAYVQSISPRSLAYNAQGFAHDWSNLANPDIMQGINTYLENSRPEAKIGYARGGLAQVKHKYAAGGTVTDAGPGVDEYMAQQPDQPSATPPQPTGTDLTALLTKYIPGGSMYGSELAQARAKADLETNAFNKMLTDAISSQESNAPSKAEMYFRLASAFGAPTRTGTFGETVGNVGKVLQEHTKETREAQKATEAMKLQLGLKGQEARMSAAKDELGTLRTLTAEEMKDKRAITSELIKDYVKSGEPQSAAGKQAQDEGLHPGTPQFQKRVSEIAQTGVDAKLAQITATLSSMNVAQANALLAQAKFQQVKEQASKLTPGEVKMKAETEDLIGATDAAMTALKRAYQLNPNTFDNSALDIVQRKALEAAGSTNPKVVATREQENLLAEKALAGLRSAFGGNPTEGERKIMLDLQGIGAKSRQEREIIMKNAFRALKVTRERQQKRLNEITQGLYRETVPAAAQELE